MIHRAEFPDAPIRAAFPISETVRLADLGGRLVTAMVNVKDRPDVIGQRVFAHAGDVRCLDLGTLRHRGRQVTVSEWTDHVSGQPVMGAILKPVFVDGPEIVEVTDFLPVITAREPPRIRMTVVEAEGPGAIEAALGILRAITDRA